ncbi:MAG: hypothetical protein ACPGJE_09750, partial [Wenzhouxiangellaceae bacterium]
MGPATNYYIHHEPFPLYLGSRLPALQLAWESWGALNEDKSNAILLFTGLSPDAHAASSQRAAASLPSRTSASSASSSAATTRPSCASVSSA